MKLPSFKYLSFAYFSLEAFRSVSLAEYLFAGSWIREKGRTHSKDCRFLKEYSTKDRNLYKVVLIASFGRRNGRYSYSTNTTVNNSQHQRPMKAESPLENYYFSSLMIKPVIEFF